MTEVQVANAERSPGTTTMAIDVAPRGMKHVRARGLGIDAHESIRFGRQRPRIENAILFEEKFKRREGCAAQPEMTLLAERRCGVDGVNLLNLHRHVRSFGDNRPC